MLSQERIIDTFIKLVKIDSPSGEEKQIADYLVDHLRKTYYFLCTYGPSKPM